jgi:phosphoribosylformylglycinamidine cyclo-ligase
MSIYKELGVDPGKENVRQAFKAVIDNEYPGAFVNIVTDPFDDSRALTQHQDGDGSKFVQRLLHSLETGDESVIGYMADDALSMNTGDIAASGFVFGPWIITDVLNLNLEKNLKELVMKAIAERFRQLKKLYADYGFNQIKFLGGETADLRDQVKSGVFDIAITAWADKKDIIAGNVKAGDKIYGFSSAGRAVWEEKPNSGIMSNGLTLARSCLMSSAYNEKYPQLKRDGDFYKGRYLAGDEEKVLFNMTVSEAIMSPTRQWPIIIREIISALKHNNCQHMLHGISMNTGGGATKIAHVGEGGIAYFKKMPNPPALFHLIQTESGEDWKAMYENFNCGVGLDVVGEDNFFFSESLKKVAEKFRIKLYELGECQSSPAAENRVNLQTNFGKFEY